MKLRRALTAVAATAVLAPAALVAAPAAYAADPDTGSAVSAEPTQAAPDQEPGDAPEAPTAAPTTDGTDAPDDAAPQPGATPTAPAATATPGPTAEPSARPTSSPSGAPSTAPSTTPSASPSDDAECTLDDASLKVDVAGLPSKLVAGAGWSRFSVKLTNTTGAKLDEVYPFVLAVPLAGGDRPTSQLHLEYQDPDTGAWTAFGEWADGEYFGWFELDAHQTAELTMRIRADRSAAHGDGFALIAGDYYNQDGSCGSSEERWYDFTVLAAGSTPGEVPPAKPGKPGNRPGPQGGSKPVGTGKPAEGLTKLPVTGNLAATGSSSALPTIGLVGGLAVVLGAGAVFTVRRRKADGGAAA
ncbi:LPXTG cell wall anchor domain-containing protein [Streptomyces sp. NPDC093097]|uniref:LPXTG cell wall anchor domain-containing protein n=1 Tax=Streptomyces sp. NPDC093097 TaxID=3366027 RepID=UPI00380DEF3C